VASGLHTEHIELIGPGSLGANTVLDVRQASERVAGHIPGSLHFELGSLAERSDDLPPGPITVMCGHGERAMSGASFLSRAGRRQLAVLVGGPADWAHATGSRLALGP
jgi:rhodanese-related sulfurtransferase